jgi:hypothetical protein
MKLERTDKTMIEIALLNDVPEGICFNKEDGWRILQKRLLNRQIQERKRRFRLVSVISVPLAPSNTCLFFIYQYSSAKNLAANDDTLREEIKKVKALYKDVIMPPVKKVVFMFLPVYETIAIK